MSSISSVGGASSAWSNIGASRAKQQADMFSKVDTDGNGSVDTDELQGMLDDIAKMTGMSSSANASELMTKLDTDGNGSLSSDELEKGMKSIMPPPSTMDFARSHGAQGSDGASGSDDLFSKIDTDGDGSVSKAELQSMMEKMAAHGTSSSSSSSASSGSGTSDSSASDKADAMFAKLDTDGDGKLSEAEFTAGRKEKPGGPSGAGGAPPPPPAGAAGADATSSASKTYDPLDTNKDGVVSAAERAAGASTSAIEALFKKVDTDGDGKISASENEAFMKTDNQSLIDLAKQAYKEIASMSAYSGSTATLSVAA